MIAELTDKKEFNIYFYNGFNEPELVADSIEQFEENVRITEHRLLLDNIGDDITVDVIENLKGYRNGNIYKEEIGNGIIVNPTIRELINMNKRWFSGQDLLMHLDNFINSLADSEDIWYKIGDKFGSEVLEYDMAQDEIDYYVSELGYEYIEEVNLYIK